MDDEDLRERFAGLGPITIRRLFGGKGIYHDGLIVAIVLRGELLIKGDAMSAPQIEAAGGRRWVYETRKGHDAAMPYWTVPDSALDDPDEMTGWARLAFSAAQRSQAEEKPKPAGRAKAKPPTG